mmetsp:Transcript_20588/g.43577  ORF Transcript_20588/g.43577 Transcript_20588/m.43577 type:complete len:89 (-) Transcript_20588:244-510(-)
MTPPDSGVKQTDFPLSNTRGVVSQSAVSTAEVFVKEWRARMAVRLMEGSFMSVYVFLVTLVDSCLALLGMILLLPQSDDLARLQCAQR